MKATKFTIDRSKWARGNDANDTLLLDGHGGMCCLGFYALACGLPERAIDGRGDYSDLSMEDIGQLAADELAYVVMFDDESGDDKSTTKLHSDLVGANDDSSIAEPDRERRITELFASIGVEVEFVDGVAP